MSPLFIIQITPIITLGYFEPKKGSRGKQRDVGNNWE